MNRNEKNVTIREIVADEGMVLTDVATETDRAKVISLGCNDSVDNYKEIDENTPLPDKYIKEMEK